MAGVHLRQTSGSGTNMFKYQVFLSFRGPDVRTHFVDILYNDLLESGFKVFKDNVLTPGKDIQSNLYEAIEQSQLCIVILSSNFAESSWCLDELVKILECMDQPGRKVVPVFYHSEPTNVRHPDEEKLKQLGKKVGHESRVNTWKKALEKISRVVGLSLSESDTNWREGLLVEKIVEEARRFIGPRQVMAPINIFGPNSFVEQLSTWMERAGSEIWNGKV